MKIYVIEGSHGQYADYSTWIVKAFISKPKATRFCKKLNDIVRENYNPVSLSWNPDELVKLLNEAGDNDVYTSDTDHQYHISEVECIE